MNQTPLLWVVIFLVHAHLYVFVLPLPLTGSKCHDDGRSALLDFKHAFANISKCYSYPEYDSPKLESWKEEVGDCCAWKGVECDGSSGHVIGLHLNRSCLYGSISSNSSLFHLVHLQRLNLAENDFNRSRIPPAIGNLRRLMSLDLSDSNFWGQIPLQVFHLVHLQRLNLAGNDFNGSRIPSAIGNLRGLTSLDLSNSNFAGQIPLQLLKLTNLSYLDLSNSYYPGMELKNPNMSSLIQSLTKLEHLNLSYVAVGAPLLDAITNLSSLRTLRLRNCALQGELPQAIFKLPWLEVLDLGSNPELSVNMPEFYQSSPLKSLFFSSVKSFGQLPTSLGNLTSLIDLDISYCEISGSIPSQIGQLTHLDTLYLSGNRFIGEIPSFLGNLVRLTYLDLNNNQLSGEIPSCIGSLVRLTNLELANNQLSGEIPSFLGSLVRLTYLEVANNQLSGEIPSCLGSLVRLTALDLSNNKLSGEIPLALMKLSELSILDVSSNQITGEIPPQIESLTRLQQIDLSYNKLHGPIPRTISKIKNLNYLGVVSNNLNGTIEPDMFFELENLEFLYLSFNNFSSISISKMNSSHSMIELGLASCNIHEFPRFLMYLHRLERLDLSYNNFYGHVPMWFFNASTKYLALLDLSNNILTGFKSYPIDSKSSCLKILDLRHNDIQGQLPIPPASISHYLISNNRLFGEIPPVVCQLHSIKIIDFAKNNLTGVLPSCLNNLSNTLSTLSLHGNKFHGQIPQLQRKICKLKMVDLSDNRLQGPLPSGLDECVQLEFLNFGKNHIVDTFPAWLGSLPNLKILILRSNKFHGVIREPKVYPPQFPMLHIIDLSMNSFFGSLPYKYFICWSAMKVAGIVKAVYYTDDTSIGFWFKDAAYQSIEYDYSVTLTNKGIEVGYTKISKYLTVIDFSSNNFTGEIPDSLGSLKELHLLNLSNNVLTSSIPPSLGNITQLEALDMSGNKLSGEIPLELTQLSFLEFFNVSNNELSGPIPHGKQFNTFQSGSYMGNLGLCGSPLTKKCKNLEASPPTAINVSRDEDSGTWIRELDWKIVLMGFGSGLVVGVITGLNSSSRIQHLFVRKFCGQKRRGRRHKMRVQRLT